MRSRLQLQEHPGVHCCLRKLRATATRPSPTRVAGMIILASASRLISFPPHPRNSLQVKPGDPALPSNFPGDLDNCSIVLTSQEESNPPEAEYERTRLKRGLGNTQVPGVTYS